MLAVKLSFPAGKFHATPWGHHVNEGKLEWPPSLWRFMRALVSIWKTSCADTITNERMVKLLEKLKNPPKYYVPPHTQSHTRHFMPIREGKRENKTLIFDAFVSMSPGASLYMIWDDAQLTGEERQTLHELLERLNYLGRAESWCIASLCDNPPEPNCVPAETRDLGVGIELLVPACEDKIDIRKLTARTGELRRKGYLRPPGTEKCIYIMKGTDYTIRQKKGGLSKLEDPTIALYAVIGPVKPLITDALVLGEMMRSALQGLYGRICEGRSSCSFSGKDESGRPIRGHSHAYFLPLDEDRDGRIDHILVYRTEGFGEGERAALLRLEVLYYQSKSYPIQLALLRLGSVEGAEVSVLQRSKEWESMTPFMLVRHPHWKREKDLPEQQLALELERRGLPEPLSVEAIDGYQAYKRLRWLDYKRFRARYLPPYNHPYGFKIVFDDDVRGPIALGYACHYGLGLFVPVR